MGRTIHLIQAYQYYINRVFSRVKEEFFLNPIFVFIFFIFMLFSCATKQINYIPYEKHIVSSIVSNQDKRTFTYYIPNSTLNEKAALLFVLHGGGGSDKGMMYLTRLSDFADAYGFIVVYVQGYGNRWNDGRDLAHSLTDQRNTDDVNFLKDLRNYFVKNFSIDESKVGVVGLSNGGFMTTKLACKTEGEFTHFISIAGGMSETVFDRCVPSRPQKILFISGKKDEVIPFAGGQAFTYSKDGKVDLGKIIPFHESLKFWSAQNYCTVYKKEKFLDGFSHYSDQNYSYKYVDCKFDTSVEGIAIENGDHSWPHGFFYQNKNNFGYLNQTMDASNKIVNFLYNID